MKMVYTEVNDNTLNGIMHTASYYGIENAGFNYIRWNYIVFLPETKKIMTMNANLLEKWEQEGDTFKEITNHEFVKVLERASK